MPGCPSVATHTQAANVGPAHYNGDEEGAGAEE